MQVEAQKPSWQTGSSAPLNLAANVKAKGNSVPKENTGFQLNLDDDAGDELIDEDELLTDEDRQRPAPGLAPQQNVLSEQNAFFGPSSVLLSALCTFMKAYQPFQEDASWPPLKVLTRTKPSAIELPAGSRVAGSFAIMCPI